MFLYSHMKELNNHSISSELCCLSDHTLLSVYITIKKEFIQEKKLTIIKNSEKEKEFVKELKTGIGNIKTSNIYSCKMLKTITQKFAFIIKEF